MGLLLAKLLYNVFWLIPGAGTARGLPPPSVVLVPPHFLPLGVTGRWRAVKSSYERLFRKGNIKQLFDGYFQSGDRTAHLLLKTPGAEDIVVSVRVNSAQHAAEASVGKVALRWQPMATEPDSFVEVKAGAGTARLRGSVRVDVLDDDRLGLGIFGEGSTHDHPRAGIRLSTRNLSAGVAVLGIPDDPLPCEAWFVGRVGRLTFGVERRPLGGGVGIADVSPSPLRSEAAALRIAPVLAFMREHGISAALGVRSAPPGRAAFVNAAVELTRDGNLSLSFVQHLAVRRRVKNIFEDDEVVGITNYVDIGFRSLVPLAVRGGKASFDLVGSWQMNKNLLLKGKTGTAGSEAVLVFKSWWNPAAALAVSVQKSVHAKHRRWGVSLQVENVGTPTFERADPHQVSAGQVQRYHASLAELEEHSMPLVTTGPPPPPAAPPVVLGGKEPSEILEARRRHEQRL